MWEFAPPAGSSARRPRGHVDDDLERDILIRLRNRPPDKKQAWRSDVLGERDWLIGRVMAEAGLRREEVAGLSIGQIQDALAIEGAPLPSGRSLQHCAKAERDRLRRWIDEDFAGRMQRETLSVIVAGKGAKSRNVPFPHDLIYDLLSWCIWGHRQTIVNTRHGRDAAYREPDTLFLAQDGQGLRPETVGKYVKAAFSAAGSALSGHRLRALFLTRFALRLWTEHFEASNFRWTQDVEQTVLVKVAEAAGHTLVTTTVKHYLQLAQLVYWNTDKESLRLIREHTLVLRSLPPHRVALITQLTQRFDDLGTLPDQATLVEEVVKAILRDPRLQPPAMARPPATPPHLRVLPPPAGQNNEKNSAISRSTSNGRRDPSGIDD
ncbi:site-specific integrase [Azospirillum brasilense]|nr:site-specific integrase [Azospirillum brasilense]